MVPASAEQKSDSNLARLRKILPHCDVLLVTATQQKYRSARVAEELAAAAAGARLVFVQTHADTEDDIRDDWRAVLADQYAAGHIFFIDSLSALADAQANRQPRGEFAQLVDLLLHELAGAAGNRIRRANFLDLLADTLSGCRKRLDDALPPVEQAINAIHQQRGVLASLLAKQMHAELLTSRRSWENRLLAETASRWGLSPFALVLRIYQGLGNWALGALLLRARTPAQIALWGTLEGVQAWRKRRQARQAEQGLDRAAAGFWDQAEIHKAGLILEGYATEAGVDRRLVSPSAVAAESEAAGANFIARASADLQSLVAGLAARYTGPVHPRLLRSAVLRDDRVPAVSSGEKFLLRFLAEARPVAGLGSGFLSDRRFLALAVVLFAHIRPDQAITPGTAPRNRSLGRGIGNRLPRRRGCSRTWKAGAAARSNSAAIWIRSTSR